jgi:hypothetical protein
MQYSKRNAIKHWVPAEFYQTFWEIIKYDLMTLFKEFHNGATIGSWENSSVNRQIYGR